MTKTFTLIVGAVFFLLGVAGFVNNPLIGERAFFYAGTTLNIVHMIAGAILWIVARTMSHRAEHALQAIGFIFLFVSIFGFILPSAEQPLFGIIHVSVADNWLHLAFGTLLIMYPWWLEQNEEELT